MVSFADAYKTIGKAIDAIQVAKQQTHDASTRAMLDDVQTWLDIERQAIVSGQLTSSNAQYAQISGQMGKVKQAIDKIQSDTRNFMTVASNAVQVASALAKVTALI
jgi:hypothetical protein